MKVGAARSRWPASRTSFSHCASRAPVPVKIERADDVAHHVVQESAGAQREHDQVAALHDAHFVQGLDRRLGLALRRAECRKIVRAEQMICRSLHLFDIECTEDPTGTPDQQRRTHGVVIQQVMIGARTGGKPRMEILAVVAVNAEADIPGPAHRNRWRQIGIKAARPRKHVALQFGIEMDDLLQSVHPGVGAPGTGCQDLGLRELPQRCLQFILHRVARRLRLPTLPGGTVVLNSEGDAFHHNQKQTGA